MPSSGRSTGVPSGRRALSERTAKRKLARASRSISMPRRPQLKCTSHFSTRLADVGLIARRGLEVVRPQEHAVVPVDSCASSSRFALSRGYRVGAGLGR